MRFFTERPALRWLAPLALVLVVGGAGLATTTATADPKLPPRTAEQLLVDLQQAKLDGLSGTVTQQANLGIPELPGGSGSRSSDFNSLLSGTHTLQVWYAGSDKARLALLGTLGESDLIVNGSDVWTWSSDDNEATHRTIDRDAKAGDRARTGGAGPTVPKTPQEAAERFLAAVGPTTEIATDSHVTVAGRAAYELVLQPRDDRSLLSQVRIAVDAEKKIPLRVQVYGQGSDPVAAVGFTSVDFTVPDDGQFAFNPPPGTKVTEVEPKQDEARADAAEKKADQLRKQRAERATTVVGTGWTTVVVTKTGDANADAAKGEGELGALLEQLPRTSGSWGSGRLLAGTAFSVVLTDDGRLAVGTVKPEVLYDALKR